MVSAEERYEKKQIKVLEKTMSYVEEGHGDPIVLLHGNPTSSYLWRNIIPHLSGMGRCIAPDLIGMGDSEKLTDVDAGSYRFVEHRRYLDAFLEAVGVSENVLLVLHDWGSGLGFDWAYRNQAAVRGIAYMEAVLFHYKWEEWPENARKVFEAMRSDAGETMVLQKNIFVENILPASVMRQLTEAEMDVYRRPFLNAGEDRRPTLTWPRQIPIEGEPADVVEIIETYARWLAASEVPKLFINADPGSILTGKAREFCRSWKNQDEVTVKGIHFIQEDSPDEIGEAVAKFIGKIEKT